MIPVCQPTVTEEDHAAVAAALSSRWLSTGDAVKKFERALCAATGYKHAVATSSCTAALFLSLRGMGIGPGHVVGVPALTFTATAAAVEHAGARVRFLDVRPDTWLLDERRVPAHLDAVVPVDLYGQPYPREAIARWRQRGMVVVEDAAHAFGAHVVGMANACCLSFYATKNVTTAGEGGAILTDDDVLAGVARVTSLHGLSYGAWERYRTASSCTVVTLGYKANMSDVSAAMGLSQMQNLSRWRARREELAARYDRELDLPRPPRSPCGIAHLYPVLLPNGVNREAFLAGMKLRGVGCGVHYEALTSTPYWGIAHSERCPVAEDIGERTVSLPLYPHLTEEEQGLVIASFKEML